MSDMKYVGVDGCPYGWFSVAFDDKGNHETMVCRTFDQLLGNYSNAALILVDIPIGLPIDGQCRCVDGVAKSILKGSALASSVFPTPARSIVDEVGPWPEGCVSATHLQYRFRQFKKDGGSGISIQTFAIIPKIGEVDAALCRRTAGAKPVVREVHPEICFWALKRQKPLRYGKKSRGGVGIEERLAILANPDVVPKARAIYAEACDKFPRTDVAKDDILDAIVAAVTAYQSGGQPQTLSDRPQWDPKYRTLPMEMVYWSPNWTPPTFARSSKQ